MSRILVTTFGSSGDLNPFIALGLGLKTRGHKVVYAVEDSFEQVLVDAGFRSIHHLAGNAHDLLESYAPQMYRRSLPFASTRIIMNKYVVPTLQAKIEGLMAACDGVDLIVAPPQQFAASAVGELTGIPLAHVNLSPVSFPSEHVSPHPAPIPLPDSLQRLTNRAEWAAGTMVLRSIADEPINAVRAMYGLPPGRNQLTTGSLSSRFTATAASPAFVPPQPDWPPYVRLTGFLFWDNSDGWIEPREVAAFLDGSKPVVAVSAGSVSPQVRGVFERFYRTSIEAIRGIGARALVIGAAPDSLHRPVPDDVLALPFAPFSQIYPRCDAVIHHGGIGTTAQALRAGKPALVVPWGFDQFFTAGQVSRIGAGRRLDHRLFTRGRAAKILRGFLKSDSSAAAHARAISARINQEDGVATLCDELETLLKSVATTAAFSPMLSPAVGHS
jgi:UDP:flavonoid glycosyltransferase YjiC (YdhE family)